MPSFWLTKIGGKYCCNILNTKLLLLQPGEKREIIINFIQIIVSSRSWGHPVKVLLQCL